MSNTNIKRCAKGFPRRVEGRISESRYQELLGILERDSSLTMSELIRSVLQNQTIRIQIREQGISELMEVLISIDAQLKKIGINLNQVVKQFHGNSSSIEKFLLGKKLLAFSKDLENEHEKLDGILSQLQLRWLSE